MGIFGSCSCQHVIFLFRGCLRKMGHAKLYFETSRWPEVVYVIEEARIN